MNAYADLTTLKSVSYLNIASVTDYDTQLRDLLETASMQLDKYTGRFFYVLEATRYYDGDNNTLFLPDDILIITTLKTDDGGEGTFENTFATTDYHLYPFNVFPKTRIEINPNGDFSHFALGAQKGVEIIGTFGFADSATPYSDSGTTLNEELDNSETEVDVVDGTALAAGQTILIGSSRCISSPYQPTL